MKIQPVISIAQLESHIGPDSYERVSDPEPPSVDQEDEIEDLAYEMEKLQND